MYRAAIHGLIALAMFGLAGAAQAQDAASDHARAIRIAETEPEAALALLKPLAEAGHAPSMATIGAMLAQGLGAPQDLAAARDWYRRGAEAGSVSGLRGFGGMLLQGEGGPKDATLGIALLLIAADAGDENARMLLSLVREEDDPGEAAVLQARDKWLKDRRLR